MKFKAILTILAAVLTGFLTSSAQSPAKTIKEIQKNTQEYIYVESTESTEEAAYETAIKQMFEIARNFVETNKPGTTVDNATIESVVEKVVLPRGNFKRVFIYAKRSDLLDGSGRTIGKTEPSEPTVSKIETDDAETVEDEEQFTVETDETYQTSDETEAESVRNFEENMKYVDEQDEDNDYSHEEFVVPPAIDESKVIDSSLKTPRAVREMIGILMNASSLHDAAKILERYKKRMVVAAYGSPKERRNSSTCYWVVEDGDKITVLGPEIDGHRYNFETGNVDALYQYERGIWFRR